MTDEPYEQTHARAQLAHEDYIKLCEEKGWKAQPSVASPVPDISPERIERAARAAWERNREIAEADGFEMPSWINAALDVKQRWRENARAALTSDASAIEGARNDASSVYAAAGLSPNVTTWAELSKRPLLSIDPHQGFVTMEDCGRYAGRIIAAFEAWAGAAIEGARAEEREACAKIADDWNMAKWAAQDMKDGIFPEQREPHKAIAAAIRSRTPVAAEADKGLSKAAADVLAERRRQIEVEGWTPDHDYEHGRSELSRAAACYALSGTPVDEALYIHGRWKDIRDLFWPWDRSWWKPSSRRRDLVKAGALILAEIERLDRAAPPSISSEGV